MKHSKALTHVNTALPFQRMPYLTLNIVPHHVFFLNIFITLFMYQCFSVNPNPHDGRLESVRVHVATSDALLQRDGSKS